MGFSRQEYWSGLPFTTSGDLPKPGTKPVFSVSPALQADSLPAESWGKLFQMDTYVRVDFFFFFLMSFSNARTLVDHLICLPIYLPI